MIDCTIVVATRNRRALLERTLVHLRALPERPPLVVVDDASTDDTSSRVAEQFPDVRLLRLAQNLGAAARTAGVRAAETRYVAFCDDDCRWKPGAIGQAVALLDAHPEVALINARVEVRGERVDEACTLMARSTLPKRSGCPGRAIGAFMAGAAVIRRDAFLAAGGFHARYHLGAEESLLALDLLAGGWEMIYTDHLVVRHDPATSERAPERRRSTVLRNRLWTAWLRHSLGCAARSTFRLLAAAVRDGAARRALRDAFAGLPWVLRERRPVDARVEALLDALTELPA